MRPLKIYLEEKFFDDYEHGKTHELREFGHFFNKKNIYEGQSLRLIKKNRSLYRNATVGEVIIGSLDEILEKVDYKAFSPNISSVQAFTQVMGIRLPRQPYIAFEALNVSEPQHF